MTNFNFYKAEEVYRETYFQLPKIFFTSNTYKEMSNDSKIAYTLLKDRFDYSIKNNWIDNDGNIYFVYTVQELMSLLNCREGKISKIKKELQDHGLLFQKRQAPKNIAGSLVGQPNFLYLGKPHVEAKDVFNTSESSQIAKIAIQNEANSTNDSSQIAKIAIQSEANSTNDSSQIAKIANNLSNNNTLDTNRHLIDTEKDLAQEKVLLDNFSTIMKDNSIATFVPENVLNLIATFSNTYAEAQQTVKTIHNAKYKAQEEAGGLVIVFEELSQYGIDAETSLYATLLKAYQLPKTEKVNNMQNVIFTYVKNWFAEYPLAAKKQFDNRR